MTTAYIPFTTPFRTPAEIAHGWNWAPGTYRCDQGWNDTAGRSYGCRAAGTRDVNGEWFCEHHAERVEHNIPADAVISCCPECQAAAGLPYHDHAPAQWYYCPVCHTGWAESSMPSNWPDPAGVVFIVLWLAFMVASLVGVLYLWLRDAMSHGNYDPAGHLNLQLHDFATLGVGLVCWLISAILIAHIANAVTGGVARIVHFVRVTESAEA